MNTNKHGAHTNRALGEKTDECTVIHRAVKPIQAAGTQMPGAKWLKLVTPSSFTLLKITGKNVLTRQEKKKSVYFVLSMM